MRRRLRTMMRPACSASRIRRERGLCSGCLLPCTAPGAATRPVNRAPRLSGSHVQVSDDVTNDIICERKTGQDHQEHAGLPATDEPPVTPGRSVLIITQLEESLMNPGNRALLTVAVVVILMIASATPSHAAVPDDARVLVAHWR